ncbi:MAG: hypothetical protein ACAI25_10320, partial [Planctomycetota bacterium]
VQIASVLLSYNVESAQRADLVIPQRLVNVAALATGSFDSWGLSRPGFLETEEARRFTLLPFIASHRAPGAARVLFAVWGLVLALLAAALVHCGRLCRAGAWYASEEAL